MILWISIILASVLLDQATKIWAIECLGLYERIEAIPFFINFYHIKNPGAAWGMFSENRWVFLIATSIATIVLPIILYKYRNIHALFGVSMSMIIGGAIGNMICVNNVVAACATAGTAGREGKILRMNIVPMLIYTALVILIAACLM